MFFTISSASRTLFLVMSYYLINNHIEVAVLNQGQVTRQAAVTYISESGSQEIFSHISEATIFYQDWQQKFVFLIQQYQKRQDQHWSNQMKKKKSDIRKSGSLFVWDILKQPVEMASMTLNTFSALAHTDIKPQEPVISAVGQEKYY